VLGVTVRKTIDTVIATWCIQRGCDLLHGDRDLSFGVDASAPRRPTVEGFSV
jgi:hypothetical protein